MVITNVRGNIEPQHRFVLIVDDDKSSSSKLQAFLKQFHYKIWSVSTAAEALRFCNIIMPKLVIFREVEDMSQIDFIRAFKRRDGTAKSCVLVISNGKEEFDERACLASGAVACLTPPLLMETLYRTIQLAIESVPRMNLRINTRLPVVINDGTKKSTEEKFAIELSENGLFILTQEPRPLKTKIRLEFKVAGETVSVDTQVIYARRPDNKAGHKPGMGLQFVRISEQDQEQIRLFIREEIRKVISTAM